MDTLVKTKEKRWKTRLLKIRENLNFYTLLRTNVRMEMEGSSFNQSKYKKPLL
jgi:hypothetical protein